MTRAQGSQSRAQPLATKSYPMTPPHVPSPQEVGEGVRKATYALSRAQFPPPACCAQGLSLLPGRARRPQPPAPARLRSTERAATFPFARARRAHQTCSTFSQPPPAVTLLSAVRPGPAGPTEVAITTGRNAPTNTKPTGRRGHVAPGRAPRPLQPRGARMRAAAPPPAAGRAEQTHNERDGAVFTELLRPPTSLLSDPAARGCCVGSVVLP